jgi:hypothetical protein
MTLEDWINYLNHDMDAVNAVYCLQKQKPYTDEEIIDAIEKIEKVGTKCGLTRADIIKTILINETTTLK